MTTNYQSIGLTRSEKFVDYLCTLSFLRLWTHPNPIGKKGNELCDCLIVCGSHIIIVSVKEIKYKDTGNITGWERWDKEAIEKSANQIWGAERWLNTVDEVIRHDGRKITLPPKSERQYHRVLVSLGGERQEAIRWGKLKHGFVLVCDEFSAHIIFGVLDTITDFVDFLIAIEALITGGTHLIFDGGGVEDLVAIYLSHNRTFFITPDPENQPDMLTIGDDIWKTFSSSEEFIKTQEDLIPSYNWDQLIELYTEDLLTDGMFDMYSKQVTHDEFALVEMVLQPRRFRAHLAKAFIEFLKEKDLNISCRVVKGFGQTAFVFLAGPSNDRELRSKELYLRCLIVRGKLADIITVIGIATDRPGTSMVGYSSDILYLNMPEWTTENEEYISKIQIELGFFTNVVWEKTK